MAANESFNPMSIATGDISGSTKLTDKFVYVNKVLWTGATTAGHIANITDKALHVLFSLIADAPGTSGVLMYQLDFGEPHPCSGIYVDDLDSGSLYFYLVTN